MPTENWLAKANQSRQNSIKFVIVYHVRVYVCPYVRERLKSTHGQQTEQFYELFIQMWIKCSG